MTIQSGNINTGVEEIAYTIRYQKPILHPNILSVHGGGPGGKEKINYLAKILSRNGNSIVSFDFSGHGESSGHMKESSLEKRVHESLQVVNQLHMDSPVTLIGTSMGGHIVLELLSYITVENLILFCPALYTEKAYTIPFGSGFTELIRQKNSYENPMVLKKLAAFRGNILLITAEKDDIIPERVTEQIKDHSVHASKLRHVCLTRTPHVIHSWAEKHLHIKDLIIREITSFLNL